MNIKFFSYIIIVMLGFLLTGCQHDDTELQVQSEQQTDVSLMGKKMSQEEIVRILQQPIKVTDSEMLNELKFMKNQDLITEQFYEVIIRTIDNNETAYPACKDYFCDAVNGRLGIQNMMKEKGNIENK